MGTFICQVPCWHNGHRYRKDDSFIGNINDLPKNKDGALSHFLESVISSSDTVTIEDPEIESTVIESAEQAEPIPDEVKKVKPSRPPVGMPGCKGGKRKPARKSKPRKSEKRRKTEMLAGD